MIWKRNNFRMGSFYLWIATFSCLFSHSVLGAMMEDLVILDELLNKGYDRRATPTNNYNNTTPTRVFCELFVRSFQSPNPLTMDYAVDLFLFQKWTDERLMHKKFRKPLDLNDPNLVKAIWKPEVYFPNAKSADFQYVTVPNVLVRINPDGQILYMLRLKVIFSCMMDLSKFPLDRQVCTMEVASFSKTIEELVLEWAQDPIIKIKRNYSCLVAEFHLVRSLGYHLVQSYLPTILMVIISWVSFWMDVNSVPGRVSLGITTLLTVSSKASSIQENLPQTSYIKAIDVWMGTCTGFVFCALLEFTIVNYLWRRECCKNFQKAREYSPDGGMSFREDYERSHSVKLPANNVGNTIVKLSDKESNHQQILETKFVPAPNSHLTCGGGPDHPVIPVEGINVVETHKCSTYFHAQARQIDEISRVVFPIAFAIFNCIYWPYYWP